MAKKKVSSNKMEEIFIDETMEISGGKASDIFEKINPMNVLEFTYQVGQDLGASSVKFGRNLYDFYTDVKKIFN